MQQLLTPEPHSDLHPDEEIVSPELTEREQEEVEQRTSVKAHVVHEAVRRDGDTEFERSASALATSGLAAGLSMGFSFIGEGVLRRYLPDAPWRPLIAKFGYSLGFLIVIIGRQQLFTENTLTAVLPVLARRNWSSWQRTWLELTLLHGYWGTRASLLRKRKTLSPNWRKWPSI